MQLSASDLNLIRIRPQVTDLYLSVFQPRTILACQVTGSVARGDRVISYYGVSSGSYISAEAGMTVLIGSTPGARDIGKIRLKSITATQITVSENSHISWAVGQYITILRFFEVWPVYPRIIPDPSNSEDVIFYKDWDIVYTNQNTILGALITAGTEYRAIWTGEQTYWSASGTSHLAGSALSYNWAFEGGSSITGSTSNTPGNVTYNVAGDYVTRLIVTGANGSTDTIYKYISVKNKPENSSSNNPVRNWEMTDLSGSRGEGGNHTSIKVTDENISIQDGSNVVIFSDDWYGNTNISLGGNSINGQKIFFSGIVIRNTIRFDYQTSSVEFEVGNISEVMKNTETFAISLEETLIPAKWFQMQGTNGKKAIYHYLRWHSTVLSLADFEFIGNDQNIQYFDTDRESLFDAVDNFLRNTFLGKLTSDRQGKLFAETGVETYTTPTGSFSNVMSITRADWMGEPLIQEPLSDIVSFIEAGGVAYSGSATGTFGAFLSQAPGATPNGRGKPDNITGLAISGQSQLNRIAGNLFASRNPKYPEIEMPLTSSFRNLDISPITPIGVDIISTDTARGIEIHAPYIVEGMDWTYSTKDKSLLPRITLKALVNGQDGETITIPDIVDNGGFDVGGFGGLGSFSKFNPIAYPAIGLGSVSQYQLLRGTVTTPAALSGSVALANFQDFSDSATTGTTSTIALGTPTGVTILKTGIYILFAHVFGIAGVSNDFKSLVLTLGATPSSLGLVDTSAVYPPINLTTMTVACFGASYLRAGQPLTLTLSFTKTFSTSVDWIGQIDVIRLP